MSRRSITGLFAFLLALDALTKQVLTTEAWAWHARSPGVVLVLGIFGLMLVPFLLAPVRLGVIVVLAGTVGNAISILNGEVANPLVLHYGRTIAFNLADVYLVSGCILSLMLALRWRASMAAQLRSVN